MTQDSAARPAGRSSARRGAARVRRRRDALPAGAPKIGMVCTPGTVAGGTHTFDLVANTGYIETPDGNSVFMWSYAERRRARQRPLPVARARCCASPRARRSSSTCTNTLPEPSSIVFPGQDAAVDRDRRQPPGCSPARRPRAAGRSRYTFTAGSPGTYLYESGIDVAKQVEMGLYGALVVRPSARRRLRLRRRRRPQFDPAREYLLLLSEIDPDLHHAVETGGTLRLHALHNRYFTINGREFPDTIQDNGSALLPNQPYGVARPDPAERPRANTQPALIRMINVGRRTTTRSTRTATTRARSRRTAGCCSPGGSASTEHFGETIGVRPDRRTSCSAGTTSGQLEPDHQPAPGRRSRTTATSPSRTATPGTAAARTSATRARCRPGRRRRTSAASGTSRGTATRSTSSPTSTRASAAWRTLLRVDPPRRLLRRRRPRRRIVGGALKSGTRRPALGRRRQHATTRSTRRRRRGRRRRPPAQTTITVASAAGFPTVGQLLRPHRQRGPAGHRRAGHDDLDGDARAARHRGGGPRRAAPRSRRWRPTGTPASPASRPASQNLKVTLQGQELRATRPARPVRP